MPSPLPYLEWFHRDFLSSSTVSAMTLVAEGIYRRLIDFQWEDEALKDDPKRLAALARASAEQWEEFAPFLDECFPLCEDGMRRNARVAADRLRAQKKVEANRENGGRGGRPRKAITNPELSETEPPAKPVVSETKPDQNPIETERLPVAKRTQSERKTIPAYQPINTVSSETDGGPSPGPLKPFDEVKLVLSMVCEDLGWEPPIDKDIRRNLKEDSALRQLVKLFGAPGAAELFCWAYREWKGRCSWEAVFDKRNQLRDSVEGRSTEANAESHLPDHVRYRKEPLEGIDYWRRSPDSGVELKPGQVLIGIEPERCVVSKTGEKLDERFNFDEWYQRRGLGVPAA